VVRLMLSALRTSLVFRILRDTLFSPVGSYVDVRTSCAESGL